MEEIYFKKGDVIIRQDDIGDSFYVLEEGLVSVQRKSNPKDPEEVPRELTRLSRNAHFGEIALLTAEPRSATVIVLSDEAKCLTMTKHEFEELLATTNKLQAESRRQIGRDVLDTVPLFKSLTTVNKKKLLEAMIPMTYLPGSYICRQGTTGNTFFIMTEGSCRVSVNTNDRSEREVATLRAGDFFGEVALIESSNRRTANVISNNTVSCLTLSRTDFNRLLRNLKVKIMEHQAMRTTASGKTSEAEPAAEARHMSSLSRKRRISGYNTHGQRDEVRIANLLRRFAKFTTEALWNSLYSRYYRDLLLDTSKQGEYGKFTTLAMKSSSSRYDAVQTLSDQAVRILELDCARRTSAEHAFILGLMKQRNQMRDKLCKGWPQHHYVALCKRLKIMRIKPFRKIVEADTRGTSAFVILRGAVRIYGSVKRGDAQAKAYFEEDLFPGEVFGEAALSGMHTRLMTAISVTAVDLIVIDDQDFMAAQDRDTQLMGTEERSRFLNDIPFFRDWDSYKLIRLAHALVQEELPKNTALTSHLTVSPSMHFIVHGRVDLVDSLEKRNIITSLNEHDYCGESGLLNKFTKAVNKKVSEEYFAVAATRLDVLVLQENAFHLFDTSSLEKLRAAFEAKVAWRRDRVLTMKWERAKVRKKYYIMHQEAARMDNIYAAQQADPVTIPQMMREHVQVVHQRAYPTLGGGGLGRDVSALIEEELDDPASPERDFSALDLSMHLEGIRPPSPQRREVDKSQLASRPTSPLPMLSPGKPQQVALPASEISVADMAYRAALVHPLDERLHNNEVWIPAARTKMSNLEDIPTVFAQDLDMLMVSSSCKDLRKLERIQEAVHHARNPNSAKQRFKEDQKSPSNARPGSANPHSSFRGAADLWTAPSNEARDRVPLPAVFGANQAAETFNDRLRSMRRSFDQIDDPSVQFYVRSLLPPAASPTAAPSPAIRPSTAPASKPAQAPPQLHRKESQSKIQVRVEIPRSLPFPIAQRKNSMQARLHHAQQQLFRPSSSVVLAPGSMLEEAGVQSNHLGSTSGSGHRREDWGLTVQGVRPQSGPSSDSPQRRSQSASKVRRGPKIISAGRGPLIQSNRRQIQQRQPSERQNFVQQASLTQLTLEEDDSR